MPSKPSKPEEMPDGHAQHDLRPKGATCTKPEADGIVSKVTKIVPFKSSNLELEARI